MTLIRDVEISAGPEDWPAFEMVTDAKRLFGDVVSTRRHLTVPIHQIEKEGSIGGDVTTLITHDGLAGGWERPGNVSKSSANLWKETQISFNFGFQLPIVAPLYCI